jgi:ribonucleoside-diphosphate reductase alpha chain
MLTEDGRSKDFVLIVRPRLPAHDAKHHHQHPEGFVTVGEILVSAHLDMQAALRPFVDNSISKTVSVPQAAPFSEFRQIYDFAYDKGLKGCTRFPP